MMHRCKLTDGGTERKGETLRAQELKEGGTPNEGGGKRRVPLRNHSVGKLRVTKIEGYPVGEEIAAKKEMRGRGRMENK
jgi:hypothetical protein